MLQPQQLRKRTTALPAKAGFVKVKGGCHGVTLARLPARQQALKNIFQGEFLLCGPSSLAFPAVLLLSGIALAIAACGKKEAPPPSAAEQQAASTALEGQVDIVAWPGYIERGETDKAYDWVTQFESRNRLQGHGEDRRHLRRNGLADERAAATTS